MIERSVVVSLQTYCKEADSVDAVYGYVHALCDMRLMSEEEATHFLDLYIWVGDGKVAWDYLEERVY